jgi:hypothetical protein
MRLQNGVERTENRDFVYSPEVRRRDVLKCRKLLPRRPFFALIGTPYEMYPGDKSQ